MKGKMTMLNNDQKKLVEDLFTKYGKTELTRTEINAHIDDNKLKNPSWLKSNTYKIGRGLYTLPIDGQDIAPSVKETVQQKTETAPVTEIVNQAAFIVSSLTGNIVPVKDNVFVPWGHFKD